MNRTIYLLCADVLNRAARVSDQPDQLPPASELRQRFRDDLERVVAQGRRYRLSDKDLAEARYALVAFIDEQVLHSEWSGRSEWMHNPLQLELFREATAGDKFFARLHTLLQRGDRPAAVEAYYLCLALGFRGAHSNASSVHELARQARRQIEQHLPPGDEISPHSRPKGVLRTTQLTWAPLLATLAGVSVLLTVLLIVLGSSLDSRLEEVQSQLAPSRATTTGSNQR